MGRYLPEWFLTRLAGIVPTVRVERQEEIENDQAYDAVDNPNAWTYPDDEDEERELRREQYNRSDWDEDEP